MNKKNWVIIFLPILLLTIISSMVSLLTSDFYFRDSQFMAIKSHYLDLINLFVLVPMGILMFVLAMKKSFGAKLFILGIMVQLAFLFGLNALSLFFNELFLVYVALFGLSIFGIIMGYGDVRKNGNFTENPLKIKISGVFLLCFALTAYWAWLTEVISSTVAGTVPESIAATNLPVSVVHVFDMAVALPIMIIGAILLFKSRKTGLIISAVMSVFMFLVCISLLGMELALQYHRMPIDEGKLYSMYVLLPLSTFPLVTLYRKVSILSLDRRDSI